MELNYATKGIANAGLTTGIIGTALGAINAMGGTGGLLGGIAPASGVGDMAQVVRTVAELSGATGRCSENTPVTRYDIAQLKELMAKDQEIAILKSEQNAEIKMADVYERIMTRVNADKREQDAWNTQQLVNNSHMSSAIAANAKSIGELQHIIGDVTKIVIPKSAICPEVMPRYNTWMPPVDKTE